MPQCKGKRRHPNQMRAIAAAIRLSRDNVPLRAYFCKGCKGWHLTKRVQLAEPESPPGTVDSGP